MENLLTDEFIGRYDDFPEHMNDLGKFVYYRTYSRWLPELQRRETWKETCRRSIEFNVGLEREHLLKIGYKPDILALRKEAESLFDNVFNLRQFLSGRTLWIGGANKRVAKKFLTANFNCSFLNIEKWDDLSELFYLLLVGTGVGTKCTKEMAKSLPLVRPHINIIHSKYKPIATNERLEHTEIKILNNGYCKIYIGDSKEGWVESLQLFLQILTEPKYEHIHTVKISYNSVRPKGERLKTFGGTASGPKPLQEMFEGIIKVLRNEIDSTLEPLERVGNKCKVRPIHILDICNLIGNNVVIGGVRRTSELFLFDINDYECLFAKYGINGFWTEEQLSQHKDLGRLLEQLEMKPDWFDSLNKIGVGRRGLNHRRMSNNSIVFDKKPERKLLQIIFEIMKLEGEPGFFNLEAAKERFPYAEGANPCGEIILPSKGLCNLTTINLTSFVKQGRFDYNSLKLAQELSTKAAMRMTLLNLELPEWDKIQKRDRFLGVSITGYQDAISIIKNSIEYNPFFTTFNLREWLRSKAKFVAAKYAKHLRIPEPLLVTTIKPEGTLSQVAGGVSSGLHYSYAPYYIRRIRINANDPLIKVAQELNWPIHAEVGTPGDTKEEQIKNARTLVIDFPIASSTEKTKNDISALEQLENYFDFQRYYTDHNSSNTIHVRPHEWQELSDKIYNNWDEFVGVSFIAHDGGTYQLAPYEEITESKYKKLKSSIKPFDPSLLKKYETDGISDLEGVDECEGGICPIR